jgi:sulfur carrier protein ThiS adenylyltransferase
MYRKSPIGWPRIEASHTAGRTGSKPIMTDFETEYFLKRDPVVLAALRKSTVAIAGAGGLGSNTAVSLARAGIGKLIIADFDILDVSNLDRQYYFIDQVGMLKVEAILENLNKVNPFSTYEIHNIKIDRESIRPIFGSADLLVEAFDLADQKQMLVEAWLTHFPQRPVIVASGLAGYGCNNQLRQRNLGSLYVCGDEAGECDAGTSPMAPRVAIVANMQANLAVELLVDMKGHRPRHE